MLYHYSDDPNTYQIHDQVLLGPFLMAAPIYHPGRTYRSAYLPRGAWYDWWTGAQIANAERGAPILADAPLERMPLYVRAGAIIPSGPALRYADERPLDALTLNIYPGDGEFALYEDDGHTFAYEQGQFCTTRYTLRRDGSDLLFTIGAREGQYVPADRRITVKVHGPDRWAADGAMEFGDDGRARAIRFRRQG
jgi:alpha-glucosidase